MLEVYILPNRIESEILSLAVAVLGNQNREVIFIDPGHMEKELEPLIILNSRLPLQLIDASGAIEVNTALKQAGLSYSSFDLKQAANGVALTKLFGTPRGYCLASVNSVSHCLQAAAGAIRLGCGFISIGTAGLADDLPPGVPLYWFGSRHELVQAVGTDGAADFVVVDSYKTMLNCFEQAGLQSDYLILYNSADLADETKTGDCLGNLWVKGLSLSLLTLAAYRNVFPYDARSDVPDPALIEKDLNNTVNHIGLKPDFLVVLASPAVIPFFYEEKKAITAWTEEMVRDIHVILNNDLFFDLAEGRLMQHSNAGLSVQLISTRRYRDIMEHLQRSGNDVLIVSTPHVDSGIIFASDDSLAEAQLVPLLEEAGYSLKQLKGTDAQYNLVGEALAGSDYFLYTGHGGPEGLHTHGHTLNRADLPQLPPMVTYTSACSTVAMVPHWCSVTEGLQWEGVAVDSRQVIGMAFVEKGALCYVGGATIEDLQYSTSIYSIFMEALLIKGMSVGEALRETRNFISLYAALLMLKKPEAYRKYRWGTANAIHQQVLLGDPAFRPQPQIKDNLKLPMKLETVGKEQISLQVAIPGQRWRKVETAVNAAEASKYYYRSRNIEVVAPYGEDVISWGDYYRIAPDSENISERAIMSGFLTLKADLPPGQIPKKITLQDFKVAETYCLLCGNNVEKKTDVLQQAGKFKIPYLLQPPLELDMTEGWAFCAEWCDNHYRVHWLVPLLLINELDQRATRPAGFTFLIDTALAEKCSGHISGIEETAACVVTAGIAKEQEVKQGEGSKLHLINSMVVLSGPEGSFNIDCLPGAQLQLGEQFPLYGLLQSYRPLTGQLVDSSSDQPVTLVPAAPEDVRLNGRLLDSIDGTAIAGGLIRLFRGEPDPVGDPLIEAYVSEIFSAPDGTFTFSVPAGSYLLYAAAQVQDKRYKSREWVVNLKEGEDCFNNYTLDQAVIISGKVTYQGYCPPDPAGLAVKRFPPVAGAGSLTKIPVDRNGRFECLVSFQNRFQIVLEEEGYSKIEDTNDGKGYKLAAQERLERHYTLMREEKDGAR